MNTTLKAFLAALSLGASLVTTLVPSVSASGQTETRTITTPQLEVCDHSRKHANCVRKAVIQVRGDDARLKFEAVSHAVECNYEGNAAAWLWITLIDKKGMAIGGREQIAKASVTGGGTKAYTVSLNDWWDSWDFESAGHFTMWMGTADTC